MSAIVSILGAKGGTGKTTVTHMLCYGLGLIGERAVCVMTDHGRETPPAGSLPYVFADGRTAQARSQIIATLHGRPGWIGVIDGGANSMDTDGELYQASDLVLIPFRDSQEDVRVVCRDLARLPRALALPSQWPTNPWQFRAAQRLLESIPPEFQNRILAPVFAISSSKLLLQLPLPESFPTAVNNAARAIARYTLRIIENGGAAQVAQPDTALAAADRVRQLVDSRETRSYQPA